MYDIGFQNLSRAMMSGKPIKVLVVDTQVYSNTGGQACTSGFIGQISDMAQFGEVDQGQAGDAQGNRPDRHGASHHLCAAEHDRPCQSHDRRIRPGPDGAAPALFNLYTSCQPEHGIGDDMGHHQAKLAVESRAYPLFRYDPDQGKTPAECFDLEGNPAAEP